jgi:hypothetical protein
VPHYYLTAGTTINLPGMRSIALRPSFLAKSDGKATIFDVSTLVFVRNRFFFGGSYRMTDAVVAMAGMMWGPGKICYSYDITTSELKNHSSNTHEIMISWCHPLTGKKHVESHVNPREMGVGPVNGSDYYVESRCTLMRQLTGTMNYVQ